MILSSKTKLMIADGVFMSRIRYILPVTAGAPQYLIKSLQTKQNEMMRIVTNKKWDIPGKILVSNEQLLSDCNWLSINQLGVYTTLSSVHQTLTNKYPVGLYNKLTEATHPNTRLNNARETVKPAVRPPRLAMTSASWRWRGCLEYNNLPLHIVNTININQFKNQSKLWIKENIPI